MSAVEASKTVSNLCSNFTKVIETKVIDSTCESCSVGWYIVAIVVLALGCMFLPEVARAELIKELRDLPSYELHNRLEALYKNKVGVKTESLQDVRRYPHVTYQDDQVTMKRTITIVEDLSWVSLPAVNHSSEERATTANAGTAHAPASNHPVERAPVDNPPPAYTSTADSSAPPSITNSPITEMPPTSSTSTREEEYIQLLGPHSSAPQSFSHPDYSPVTDEDDSESDIEHIEFPPAYSPTIQSINDSDDDSDSEANRPAHP